MARKYSRGQWRPLEDFHLYTEMPAIAAKITEFLAAAREEILLETYIFEGGDWPAGVVDILTRKAQAGVRVHLTLDALGSLAFPRAWVKQLQQAGVRLAWYNPLGLRRHIRRTHRRILVIDNALAALGGFAISDVWLKGAWTQQPYRDTLLSFRGEMVGEMRRAFALLHPLPLPRMPVGGKGRYPFFGKGRLIMNSPPRRRAIHGRLLAVIAAARQQIWIATPYYNPDFWMRRALYKAARRGVDVRVLLPGPLTDHPILRHGCRRYYHKMLAAGVRIFEYLPAFLHGKYVLVDEHWGTVGSANLDLLSHWFNHELNLELRGQPLCQLLESLFLREFEQAPEIDLSAWEARPRWQRYLEDALGIIDRVLQKNMVARYKR